MKTVIILFLSVFLCATITEAQDKLKLSVYYESLCRDSMRFITEQLHSNYRKVQRYVDLELIPFGKTKVFHKDDKTYFRCHHGDRECYGNKVQSCVLSLYIHSKGLNFVNCVMNSHSPSSKKTNEKCAAMTEVNWKKVETCMEGPMANRLLEKNGKKTHSLQSPLIYVPTIVFNKVYNSTLQYHAEGQFLKIVCKLLDGEPTACNDPSNYDL